VLITTLVTLLTVRENPGNGVLRKPSPSTILSGFRIDIKQNKRFIWFIISRALMGMPGVILQTFVLYYLIDVKNITDPAEVTGDVLLAVGGGLIAVVYFAGRLSDKIGRRPILITSGFVGAGGVALLYFSQSYAQIMIAGALIGVASGAFLSTSWALATDLLVAGEEAKYLGLTNFAAAGGSALARLIGPLIDYFNTYGNNLGYSVMLMVCIVCFIAASLLLLKLKDVR